MSESGPTDEEDRDERGESHPAFNASRHRWI